MTSSRTVARLVAVGALAGSALVAGAAGPATAATDGPPPESTAAWLIGELDANDGELPVPPDFEGTDWGLTADAIMSLTLAGYGEHPTTVGAYDNFAANIENYVTGAAFGDPDSTYAGPTGKALTAAAIRADAGLTADLEARSRALLTDSGRFSDDADDDYSNGFGQAFNVIGLSGTDEGAPDVAVDFLVDQQCPNGSFRLGYDNEPVTPGCEDDAQGDTDATALAIQALIADDTGGNAAPIAAATDWLLSQQDDEGGFGGAGPTAGSNSNSTGLVAQTLRAVGTSDALAAADAATAFNASITLTPDNASGTPADDDLGAIGLDRAAFDAALEDGIDDVRDQWRRSTVQAVLADGLAPYGAPSTSDLVPITPDRVYGDNGEAPVTAGGTITVPVAGTTSVPDGAGAVVANITAVGADAPGYLTAWDCGADRNTTSNVNFLDGTATPNVAVVPLSADGELCVYAHNANVEVLVDVTAFVPAGGDVETIAPDRFVEFEPIAANAQLTVPVAGVGDVPADATAVAANITVTGADAPGYVTAWDCAGAPSGTSTVNFYDDGPAPNGAIVPLSGDGEMCLYSHNANVEVTVDVSAAIGADSDITPISPARALDHADDNTIPANGSIEVRVAGIDGVPEGAAAAVLNLTALGADRPGYLTAWDCTGDAPLTSLVNVYDASATPNGAVVGLSDAGTLCIHSAHATTDVLVDVAAYVAG